MNEYIAGMMFHGQTTKTFCSGVSMSDEAIGKNFMMKQELSRILTGRVGRMGNFLEEESYMLKSLGERMRQIGGDSENAAEAGTPSGHTTSYMLRDKISHSESMMHFSFCRHLSNLYE